jgi:hypothetical protein
VRVPAACIPARPLRRTANRSATANSRSVSGDLSALGRYAGAVVDTIRFNRLRSVRAWIWNLCQYLWALSLPALIVLKLTGVIGWSWWWVLLSPLWIGSTVLVFRFSRPGSVGAWVWNRGADLWAFSLPAFIVLKLTGVIAWSWWWVLSPLWISGILVAPVLLALLILLGRHMYRRAMSNAVGDALP